jgi:hypothetical protein
MELSYWRRFDEVLAHFERCHICFNIEDIYFIKKSFYNKEINLNSDIQYILRKST